MYAIYDATSNNGPYCRFFEREDIHLGTIPKLVSFLMYKM
jgi:hypothetical protein